MIKIVVPLILLMLITTTLIERISSAYGGYPRWALFAGGWAVLALVIGVSFFLMRLKGKPR